MASGAAAAVAAATAATNGALRRPATSQALSAALLLLRLRLRLSVCLSLSIRHSPLVAGHFSAGYTARKDTHTDTQTNDWRRALAGSPANDKPPHGRRRRSVGRSASSSSSSSLRRPLSYSSLLGGCAVGAGRTNTEQQQASERTNERDADSAPLDQLARRPLIGGQP